VKLTRRGWTLSVLVVLLLAGGRLFGLLELFLAAATGIALMGFALVSVGTTRLRLEVARSIRPPRVHAGTPSRVDLRVRNRSRRRAPALRLEDSVTGTRGAQLLLAPLAPGEASDAAYRLPTERRGIVDIGPLSVVCSDPFGLVELRMQGAGTTELTVLPTVHPLAPPPHTAGDDPLAGADHPNALGRSGDDFYALRRYVIGDDLRRVHWPATARHDELMVRQDEIPWQGRTTILVDIRRTTTTAEAADVAVSAAASIVLACWRRQDLVRLLTTDGTDTGFAAGHNQVDAIMEHLATVQPSTENNFRASVDRLGRGSTGGAFVAIVPQLGSGELEALARLRNRFGWTRIVIVDRSAWDPSAPDTPANDGDGVLHLTRRHSLTEVWARTVRRRPTVLRDRAPAGSGRPR
jgi:uncharacterized protein (DUF58 family)